ncbi:adenine phosphoribosyltransferase [Candidatus Latescibacterota bacterium]
MSETEFLRQLIRDVPDFPKPGILFKDITTLLSDPRGLACAVKAMSSPFAGAGIDRVVGVEARGFILGAPVALDLGCGFVPVRKEGKLPGDTARAEYDLEYGRAAVEIHRDSIDRGSRVLLADDVLATGGTMRAVCDLVEELGGEVAGISFLVELLGLGGRSGLEKFRIESVIAYD